MGTQKSTKILMAGAGAAIVFGVIAGMMLYKRDGNEMNLANPRIEIRKSERVLVLFDGRKEAATFRIGLGFSPIGDKEREGDGRTPEGEFYIFVKNPESRYHLSLGVSYPGPKDADRGLRNRLISREESEQIHRAYEERSTPLQKTALGGEIYIHGNGSGSDWTDGCVALDDADMEALFKAVPKLTPVTILP